MRKHSILVVAALSAYGLSLRGSFHFDDYSLALKPSITLPAGLAAVWHAVETRPLTNSSFWLNYELDKWNPVGYHAANVAVHAGAVVLLYSALALVLPESGAFWAALIFAIHPIQSETVCYIFARSTLLSTAFCIGSLWLWLRGRLAGAAVLFALALLSKEECVTFPFMLLLLPGRNRKQLVHVAIMFALALCAGVRAIWATAYIVGSGAGFSAGVTPLAYFTAQGAAILRYLRLLVLPWGFTIEPTVTHPLLGWILVLCILGTVILAFRKKYSWAMWALCGFILLVPSSSIFPAADLAADRRMYLPMIAFAALFGTVQPWLKNQVSAAIAVVLLFLSIGRTEVWRTEQSLWREATRQSPTHARPLVQLARTVPPQQAITMLSQAKFLEPGNGSVAAELGRLWLASGNHALALQEFGRALALAPNDAVAYNNRGAALLALKQYRAAALDFSRALRIDPCIEAARRNLRMLSPGTLPACPATAK